MARHVSFANSRVSIPHPIPYQGSKRKLAPAILQFFPDDVATLIEPFAGSAAITVAAADRKLARSFLLNDLNRPLMQLWEAIIQTPELLASQYEEMWLAQLAEPRRYYDDVRARFNRHGDPADLLFLLLRCVKGAVRYNREGEFNQSPDLRRKGAVPATLRKQFQRVSLLLKGRTKSIASDYAEVCRLAQPADLIYMDPPYQGVSGSADSRYLKGLEMEGFTAVLRELNAKGISYMISFDGRTGDRSYGERLPAELGLVLHELAAGRSTQATLLGRNLVTYESLYLSPALKKRGFGHYSHRECHLR